MNDTRLGNLRRRAAALMLIGAACGILCPSVALAQYSISWYTIDGGGAMFTSAGAYELSGTIGQPDAGFLNGAGAYDIYGGFWVPRSCAGFITCDANCDGVINFSDINAFVDAISDPEFYGTMYPDCSLLCNCDANGDGAVNFDDINPMVDCLSAAAE